ncbi:M15 family metallopeptidase [Streptomyces sp. B6B3]|uniref:M15 family metallopeptidase n=1 Tax=Streptomyces sp. B6B3 TaxID=3153570 RepID=UPI00325E457F
MTAWLGCVLTGSGAPVVARAGGGAPPEFVALRDVAPGVAEDMRYAGRDNFVGEVVDGYREPVCLLTRDAALALGRAERALAARGLGLRVYDCYRPRRAVRHFLRWATEPERDDTRAAYHPRVPKAELFERGYLAERSGHSRGSTVDVTLVRAGGGAVDMGTPFDFFDPRSHPGSTAVGAEQRAARETLRAALVAEGFVPLPTEWWHFSYEPEPFPERSFDFPVARTELAGGGTHDSGGSGATPVGPGPPLSLVTDAGRRTPVHRPRPCHPFGTSAQRHEEEPRRRVSRRRRGAGRVGRWPGAGRPV